MDIKDVRLNKKYKFTDNMMAKNYTAKYFRAISIFADGQITLRKGSVETTVLAEDIEPYKPKQSFDRADYTDFECICTIQCMLNNYCEAYKKADKRHCLKTVKKYVNALIERNEKR